MSRCPLPEEERRRGRAQALGSLAGQLPADDRPAVLAQALAAVTAISDDSARAQALGSLAGQLPAGQLADVLALIPRTIADPLAAVLMKGRSVLLPGGDGEWLGLLRNAVNGTDRATCLIVIVAIAPAIAEIGGATAIWQCVNAIEDAHRWWP